MDAGAARKRASRTIPETARERQAELASGGAGAVGTEKPAAEGTASVSSAVAQVVKFPVTALGAVAGDISSAARRPDALLYWGGLAGLAAFGVLEWPAAAAIGVGVAVAHGVRRTRA